MKFNEHVLFYGIRKVVGFLLEAGSNYKIKLIKTNCIVSYHGHNNGNHGYCEQRLW